MKGLADFQDEEGFRLMHYGYDAMNRLSRDAITREASNLLREIAEARESRNKVRASKECGLDTHLLTVTTRTSSGQ